MEYLQELSESEQNSSDCSSYYIPSVQEYFKAANKYGIILACVGAVALLLSIALYIDTVRHVMRNASPRIKTNTAFVISVYPVICLVSYMVLLVPRSYLLSEATSQVMFAVGMYQLWCLFISYCGGHAQLVNKVESFRLSLKVSPCCCWPCCSVLPTFEVNKKTVRNLKLLVLQLPVFQVLGYFISLVVWAEDANLYQQSYRYLQPILTVSIMSGMWGMAMTINLLKNNLNPEFLMVPKFGALQAVLILVKLQEFIAKSLVTNEVIPCNPPLTAQTYATLANNMLIVLEMVLLGFVANRLFKREMPDILQTSSNKNSIDGADNDGFIL